MKFIIKNTTYTTQDDTRPTLMFPEYEVYDIKMNKGFIVGTHQWDTLTIHGDEKLKIALLENSGGNMVVECDNSDTFDMSVCYLLTDSDLESNVLKIKFKHSLLV